MKREDVIFSIVAALPKDIRGEVAFAIMCRKQGEPCELSKDAKAAFAVVEYHLQKADIISLKRAKSGRRGGIAKNSQIIDNEYIPNVLPSKSVAKGVQVIDNEDVSEVLPSKIKQNNEEKGKGKEKAKEKEKVSPLINPYIKEKDKEKESPKGKGEFTPDNNKLLSCPIDVVEAAQSDVTTSLNTSLSVDAPQGIHCAAEPSEPKQGARMKRPSVEEVQEYCDKMGYTFSSEEFVAFYESNGWKVGKNPMKSWQAACRTWQGSKPKKRPKDALPDTLPAAEWDSFRTWMTNNAPSLPPVTPDNYLDMKAAVHRRLQVLADILLAIARMPHVDSVVAEVKRLCNQQPYYNQIWN